MEAERERWFERLRSIAEELSSEKQPAVNNMDSADAKALINEIQVYQTELEILNEELRTAQLNIEKSHHRFEKLFQMAPVGYAVIDNAGMILEANRTMAEMVQKNRKELFNRPFSQFVFSEDQAVFLGRFHAFYKNPVGKSIELRLIRSESSNFYARIEGTFINFHLPSQQEDMDYFCIVVSDITTAKESEFALHQSEAEYRNLVGTLNDAVISADANGQVLVFNRCAESMFGWQSSEIIGKPISVLCPADRKTEQQKMLQQVFQNTIVPPYETERLSKDGCRIPVEVTLGLRTDDHGKTIGVNAVMRDITGRRQKEDALNKSREKLNYILDSLPEMILEVDTDMKVLWANKTALELNPDPIGRTCYEAFPGKRAICDGCHCARAFDSGRIENGVMYQGASKTAGESYWENFGIPLTGGDGSITVLEVSRNITDRKKNELEKEELIRDLTAALAEINTLNGLLPICSHCKKIRNDEGYWDKLEAYIEDHSEARFSHGICPACFKELYPGYEYTG